MRAFRPSRFGSPEEELVDPADVAARNAKIGVYAKRAEAHLPLFQEQVESPLELRTKRNGRSAR